MNVGDFTYSELKFMSDVVDCMENEYNQNPWHSTSNTVFKSFIDDCWEEYDEFLKEYKSLVPGIHKTLEFPVYLVYKLVVEKDKDLGRYETPMKAAKEKIAAAISHGLIKYDYVDVKNQEETTNQTNTKEENNMTTENNKTVNINNKLDIAGMMKMKMADAMIKGGNDIQYDKLMTMQAIGEDGKIDIAKMMAAKMQGKLMQELDKGEDLPLEKLMMLQMLQDGDFDINKLIQIKLIGKLFGEETKPTAKAK